MKLIDQQRLLARNNANWCITSKDAYPLNVADTKQKSPGYRERSDQLLHRDYLERETETEKES